MTDAIDEEAKVLADELWCDDTKYQWSDDRETWKTKAGERIAAAIRDVEERLEKLVAENQDQAKRITALNDLVSRLQSRVDRAEGEATPAKRRFRKPDSWRYGRP